MVVHVDSIAGHVVTGPGRVLSVFPGIRGGGMLSQGYRVTAPATCGDASRLMEGLHCLAYPGGWAGPVDEQHVDQSDRTLAIGRSGRGRISRRLPVVDLAAIADGDDHDQQHVVSDGSSDAVVPDVHTPA